MIGKLSEPGRETTLSGHVRLDTEMEAHLFEYVRMSRIERAMVALTIEIAMKGGRRQEKPCIDARSRFLGT